MGLKLLIIICFIILIGIIILPNIEVNNFKPITTTYQIYSIADTTGFHGSFALGTGYINSYPVYYYYEGTPQTGLILKSIPAKNAVIYMDTEQSPYITDTFSYDTNEHHYTIHIPKGSVIHSYNLDLR